jgi:hypothetical protein
LIDAVLGLDDLADSRRLIGLLSANVAGAQLNR